MHMWIFWSYSPNLLLMSCDSVYKLGGALLDHVVAAMDLVQKGVNSSVKSIATSCRNAVENNSL